MVIVKLLTLRNLDVSSCDLFEVSWHMSGWSEGNLVRASILTDWNWVPPREVLQCYHYSHLFSYTQYSLEKSQDKCSVLNNTYYKKYIHIIIHFVHRYEIQLLTCQPLRHYCHLLHMLSSILCHLQGVVTFIKVVHWCKIVSSVYKNWEEIIITFHSQESNLARNM